MLVLSAGSETPDLPTTVPGLFVTQTVLHHSEQMSPVAFAGGQTPSEEVRRTAVLVRTVASVRVHGAVCGGGRGCGIEATKLIKYTRI